MTLVVVVVGMVQAVGETTLAWPQMGTRRGLDGGGDGTSGVATHNCWRHIGDFGGWII